MASMNERIKNLRDLAYQNIGTYQSMKMSIKGKRQLVQLGITPELKEVLNIAGRDVLQVDLNQTTSKGLIQAEPANSTEFNIIRRLLVIPYYRLNQQGYVDTNNIKAEDMYFINYNLLGTYDNIEVFDEGNI